MFAIDSLSDGEFQIIVFFVLSFWHHLFCDRLKMSDFVESTLYKC